MILKVFATLGLFFLLFFFIALYDLIPIFTRTFPLQNTEAVLFSLTQNVMGAQDFAIHLMQGALFEALKTSSILFISLFSLTLVIFLIKKKKHIQIFHLHAFLIHIGISNFIN